ncbi:hypothetical protein ACFQ0T_20090 [Kitasatospora gansuensis]
MRATARARLTAPWPMLLLPVLLAAMDAALVAKNSSWWELTLSGLATGALLLRRRCPLLTLLLVLPGTFVNYIWIAPITAVYSVAAYRPGLRTTTLCASVFALVEFFHWPLEDHPLALDRDNALYAIQCVMLGAAPAAIGLLARTRTELAARLDELTEGRHRENRLLADRVLSTERPGWPGRCTMWSRTRSA